MNRQSTDETHNSTSDELRTESLPLNSPANIAVFSAQQNGLVETQPVVNSVADSRTQRKRKGTFELKFLIDDLQTTAIMAWARQHLEPDTHSDPEIGDGYRVNSLYLDTPQFDVFHREEGFQQQKYRLRRYGSESLVWFEQKRKRKGLVRKRRVSVEQSDIVARLQQPLVDNWEGFWFRSKIDKQLLRPVCRVTYQRFARLKSTANGTMRLTIDDHLTATPANGWEVPSAPLEGLTMLEGKRILELKFCETMPAIFRQVIEEYQLQVTSFSKYRTSVEKCIPRDVIA